MPICQWDFQKYGICWEICCSWKIGDSISRWTNIGANTDLGKWLKSGKDTRINIESKNKIELSNWASGSHSY